jgi:hypothetical protein
MNASKLQPSLLGGLFIGVLSALPIISAGNCLCCLWVVSGGVLAAYLLQQNQAAPLEAGDGAIVGLLAGLVGAVLASLLAIPIQMVMGPLSADMFRRIADQTADAPPELRSFLDQLGSGSLGAVAIVLGLVMNLVFFSVFGLLGGLLGQALFKKSTPPPVPAFLDPTRPSHEL